MEIESPCVKHREGLKVLLGSSYHNMAEMFKNTTHNEFDESLTHIEARDVPLNEIQTNTIVSSFLSLGSVNLHL